MTHTLNVTLIAYSNRFMAKWMDGDFNYHFWFRQEGDDLQHQGVLYKRPRTEHRSSDVRHLKINTVPKNRKVVEDVLALIHASKMTIVARAEMEKRQAEEARECREIAIADLKRNAEELGFKIVPL